MANNNRRRAGGWGMSASLTGPGGIFTVAFIALAIGFGVLLSRGVTPSSTLTEPEDGDVEVELIPETPAPGQKGLQLKTLKFQSCASTITIDLMLDKSQSMNYITPSGISKIQRLIEAVTSFLEKAQDSSVIGIQTFHSNEIGLSLEPDIKNDIPIAFYRDARGSIPPFLSSLSASGSTPTYEALKFSYRVLSDAIKDDRFKNRKFNFIFISDGAPCPGIGCFGIGGANQDPRLYNPNPSDQIKALGVNVYTLGIFDNGETGDPRLEELLRSIASSPDNYYAADNADDTKRLLSQISNKICNQEVTPTP